MFLIFTFSLFLFLSPLPVLLIENANEFVDIIFHLQSLCVSQIPENSQFKDLSAAFLCGKNIGDPWKREIFQKTGLIHLLVVSGGHFAFLLECLQFFSFRKKGFQILQTVLLWLILISFSFMTGFQAPVVRALMTLIFKKISEHFLWQWDPGKTQLAAGLCILSLNPAWLYSISFYLSWLTSLSLCFPFLWQDQSRSSRSSIWKKATQWISTCFCVQAVIGLFFWSFSYLGFVLNALLAPLLMLLLWPLSLGILVFSPLVQVIDFFWKYLLLGLEALSRDLSSPDFQPQNLHWLYLWSVIITLHLLAEVLRRLRFQGAYA